MKIRGGISYFLWDRDHDGPCEVADDLGRRSRSARQSRATSTRTTSSSAATRPFRSWRRSRGRRQASRRSSCARLEPGSRSASARTSTGKPTERASRTRSSSIGSQKVSWVERVGRSQRTPHGSTSGRSCMTARPGHERGGRDASSSASRSSPSPGTACTETYLVAGRFDTEAEATQLRDLPAHPVRSLPRLAAQDHPGRRRAMSTRSSPTCRWIETWTDAKLYERYGLTDGRDRLHRVAGRRARRDCRRIRRGVG